MEEDPTQQRSEQITDILGKVPDWIVQWGITVIFTALVILLVLAWFIKYPDILPGRILITTVEPPIKVVAKSSGKIQRLFVDENTPVQAGAYLAEIENPANLEDMLHLKKQVLQLESSLDYPEKLRRLSVNNSLLTGQLQSEYNQLKKLLKDYSHFIVSSYYPQKIDIIKRQIENYNNNNTIICNQLTLAEQELTNSRQHYLINQKLHTDKIISQLELKTIESVYLQKQIEVENLKRNHISSKITLDNNQASLIDVENEFGEKKREILLSISNTLSTIKNLTNEWEQKYIIKAPTRGNITFLQNWTANQFVTAGEETFAIIGGGHSLSGILYVTGNGLGKVQIGQKVRIRLDIYPFEQYGQLFGRVKDIAPVSAKDLYKITISLPEGLKTTYNKELAFKPEMKGTAEIITNNRSVLERIFNKISNLIRNST